MVSIAHTRPHHGKHHLPAARQVGQGLCSFHRRYFLFIGDVGRPDLAVKSDLSREDLAGHLFDSLRNKIMPLADSVIVYPGHGAGSACGKKMAKELGNPAIGQQKALNYALRADMTRAEFVKEVTEGLVDPPQYFPKNAVMNKIGSKHR